MTMVDPTWPSSHHSLARRQARSSRRTIPGLVTRFTAFVIDIFVMALACIFATQTIALTLDFFRFGTLAFGHRLLTVARAAVLLLVIVLYLPVSWAVTGSSVGKGLLGLRIVRVNGKPMTLFVSFLRFFGYWLSALPLGAGFVCALADKELRTLHDRLAGTRVVYRTNVG
jgi:uncharacterized RDD family membrane protein YckC